MSKKQPIAFMSYTHIDDEHSNSRLTTFCEKLSGEVCVQTGKEFPIFQDRKDIKWGQDWNRRIVESLDEITFLIPIITPNFFTSKACCAELRQFIDRERTLGRDDLILPVYYISTSLMDNSEDRVNNELAQVLSTRQREDWRELRFEPFQIPKVGKALAHLASQIRDALNRTLENEHPSQLKPYTYEGPIGASHRQSAGSFEPRLLPLEVVKGRKRDKDAILVSKERATTRASGLLVRDEDIQFPENCDEPVGESNIATRQSSPVSAPQTHIVDLSQPDVYHTIMGAVDDANPGDRILVRQGCYHEELLIEKPLEIIGDGDLDAVIVEATGRSALTFKTNIGRVVNITLRQKGEGYCVDIPQGYLELEGCDITSQSLACVAIHGGSSPCLRNNSIHGGAQCGVLFYENGQGSLEDNEIFNNSYSGVEILNGGNPTLRCNRIYKNKQGGILVHGKGKGTLEYNEIFSNTFAGVEIRGEGDPLLRYNRIHNGKQGGVLVYEKGKGTLEENEIFDYSFAGVEIEKGGNPLLRHNRIYYGKMAGIYVAENGTGVLEDNDIFSNSFAGISIENKGDPLLQRNRIFHGKMAGVYITDNGLGVIEDNDIFGNALAGIAITNGSNPVFRRNRIHDGNIIGVFVSDNGRGRLEDNDIYENSVGVEICKRGDPILRKNRINRNIHEAICVHDYGGGTIEDNDLRDNGDAWKISSECEKKLKRSRNQE